MEPEQAAKTVINVRRHASVPAPASWSGGTWL